jgi:L-ascorbate metabolism protein UlaG (beta-lactamase superfamily)
MEITQIRNATVLIEFGGSRFLVDPVLSDKDSYPGFPVNCPGIAGDSIF